MKPRRLLGYSLRTQTSTCLAFLFCVLFLGSAFMSQGCSGLYFHDSERQSSAEAIQKNFQEIIKKGRVSDLVANYRSQQVVVEDTHRVLQGVDNRIQLNAILPETWVGLIEKTGNEIESIQLSLEEFEGEKKSTEAELKKLLDDQSASKKKSADLVEAINNAALVEANYVASQELIGASLSKMVAWNSDEPIISSKGIASLQAALNKEISLRTFTASSRSGLVEEESKKKVGELLNIDQQLLGVLTSKPSRKNFRNIKTILKRLPKLKKIRDLQLTDPGLMTSITSLSYDLARSEEQRIGLAINNSKKKINMFANQMGLLKSHLRDLKRNKKILDKIKADLELAENVRIRDTLSSLSRVMQQGDLGSPGMNKKKGQLRTIYEALAQNYLFRVIHSKDRGNFYHRINGLRVEESLAKAEIKLREREAVILRGLEGLVAFYKGGIDSQDIDGLIGLGQTIGISVIAAD